MADLVTRRHAESHTSGINLFSRPLRRGATRPKDATAQNSSERSPSYKTAAYFPCQVTCAPFRCGTGQLEEQSLRDADGNSLALANPRGAQQRAEGLNGGVRYIGQLITLPQVRRSPKLALIHDKTLSTSFLMASSSSGSSAAVPLGLLEEGMAITGTEALQTAGDQQAACPSGSEPADGCWTARAVGKSLGNS